MLMVSFPLAEGDLQGNTASEVLAGEDIDHLQGEGGRARPLRKGTHFSGCGREHVGGG